MISHYLSISNPDALTDEEWIKARVSVAFLIDLKQAQFENSILKVLIKTGIIKGT